jgi:hypothetical protein
MKTCWNVDDHGQLCARLQRLTPDSAALWGRMSAPQMVVHLCDAFRMATGDLPVASKKLPFRYPPLKQLVVYVLPFPKGAPTAPELLRRQPGDWLVEMQELQKAMDRFVTRGPSGTAAEHPAFGRLTGRAWGVLAYNHTDHHLRQFGV